METALLSKTVSRLPNQETGLLQRRTNEIVRRIEGGALDFSWAAAEMQRIIEGKKLPEIQYRNKAPLVEFVRPSRKLRRKSAAPIEERLPHSRQRLNFPQRTPEHVMAEMWEAECIPLRSINFGRTPIDAIMGEEDVTARDRRVIASALQYFATPIGSCFLTKYLQAVEHRI